jgi:tetratricopeptide (TPR) repeat protein
VSLGSFVLLALVGGLAGTAWQARVAARERDLSLAQLERAESTNAFTSFLLGQAPGGRPVPVQEILARAERLVDKRFAADEPLAVDLLVTIASIYDTRNETDGARRTMKRAHEMSQRVADAAVRAKASCGWARAFSAEGDFAGAYRLIDKALAETTDEARFDSVVANCLLERGIVAMTEVNAADAADAGDRALRRLDRRPGAFPEIRADVLQLLAVSRRLQGDTRGANRRFAEALEQVQRIGRGETMDASILLNNWAGNMAMTNSLQALVTYGRAITILQGESPDSAPSAARINYGVQLNRLARYAEARSSTWWGKRVTRSPGLAGRAGTSHAPRGRCGRPTRRCARPSHRGTRCWPCSAVNRGSWPQRRATRSPHGRSSPRRSPSTRRWPRNRSSTSRRSWTWRAGS